MEAIYHLTESHAPGLRCKAEFQFEKNSYFERPASLNKENIAFDCSNNINVDAMLKKVEEMPKGKLQYHIHTQIK